MYIKIHNKYMQIEYVFVSYISQTRSLCECVCVGVCACLCVCVCVCVNVFEMMYVKFVLSISRQRQLSHQENKFDKLFEAMRM